MKKRTRLIHGAKICCCLLTFQIICVSCKKKQLSPAAGEAPIAYAFPIDGIFLDGDLSDWPEDLICYPIKHADLGEIPKGREDYTGNFRIGYQSEENALCIGMEILDESLFTEPEGDIFWDSQDGLELYLDIEHQKGKSRITQYAVYGNEQFVYGDKGSWENVDIKKRTINGKITAEWRIQLNKKIAMGSAMGLDLVVIDKDKDNTFSWISWGKGTQKLTNPERCGTVIFVEPGSTLGRLQGNVSTSGPASLDVPVGIRISHTNNPGIWAYAMADSTGLFTAQLPLGEYAIDIPSKLIGTDEGFLRIASVDPIVLNLDKDGSEVSSEIRLQLAPKPDLIPAKGVLHAFNGQQQNVVDAFIKSYQEFYNIPGISLALIKKGKLVYHKTYGVKNTKTLEPVDEKTLFEAASITKPVFAYVVLRLADRGEIDLDRPLHEYLPFEALEEYPAYKKMTARHVLVHRSGLPNWGVELENVPGEKYGYSGEGFEYLKRVTVHITGKPIEQLLDEELITPFRLYHMEFSDSEALRKVVAMGHQGNQPTNWGIPQEAGMAFSMHTEAKAFAKFALTLFEKKGLKPSTYKEFMTLHTESNPEYWNHPERPEGAGLGIFVRESDFGKVFFHGGNNGDFKCQFEVYQDLGMGYICFTNSDTGSELTQDLWRFFIEGK
ncbi:MAG: serine hydrolase [Bacteroidota bacterium]